MPRQVLPLFLLVFILASCSSGGGTSSSPKTPTPTPNPTPTPTIAVAVTPSTANIRAGSSLTFSASVTGTSNSSVSWSVNNTPNGSSALGTISATGNYTAPATLPSPNTLTITATSTASSTATSSSAVTLLNPTPMLLGLSPTATNLGNYSLTITGSNFVSGAQVLLNGSALPTTFVSSSQLTATGSATSSGTFTISVQNPDPGSSTSAALNLQVNGSPQTSSCSQMSTGQGASLNGFLPFPADNLWNKDISSSPVDPNSAAVINYIGPTIGLHPDFGSGQYNGSYIGIPYTVVDSSQPLIRHHLQRLRQRKRPRPHAYSAHRSRRRLPQSRQR